PINVPFDIIYEILQHCDNTSLANFALLNKTYRSASEPLLYGSLEFDKADLYSGRLEKCLATLSVCPQKASYCIRMMLKLLFCDLENVRYDYSDDRFFGYLETAFIAVDNLQYLMLGVSDFFWFTGSKTSQIFVPVLRKCTFSLHTIVVPECIEPALWAQRHDNLRDIQIFYAQLGFNYEYFQVYQKWTTESSFMLTVSGYGGGPLGTWHVPGLTAFPIMKPRWSARPITALFERTMGCQPYIQMVELFVSSVKTETFLESVMSVAECFPYVNSLELTVADGEIYVTSAVFIKAISSLPRLERLTMYAQKNTSSNIGPQHRIRVQQLYASCCPLLNFISFSHHAYGGGIFDFVERDSKLWEEVVRATNE
ncbi:hypothetical protein H0H93_009209, partial [Arthromyces matolae]